MPGVLVREIVQNASRCRVNCFVLYKKLTYSQKIKGNFSTHLLCKGGTTAMRAARVPLSHIKERSRWVLDCVFKYIKPTVSEKLKWDAHYVR